MLHSIKLLAIQTLSQVNLKEVGFEFGSTDCSPLELLAIEIKRKTQHFFTKFVHMFRKMAITACNQRSEEEGDEKIKIFVNPN